MKSGRIIESHDIPIEVWKSLGAMGAARLTKFRKLWYQEKAQWTDKTLVPKYQTKDDI